MLKSKASLNRMDSASLETVDEESPIVDFEQPAYQILPPRAGLLARMTPRRTVAAATLVASPPPSAIVSPPLSVARAFASQAVAFGGTNLQDGDTAKWVRADATSCASTFDATPAAPVASGAATFSFGDAAALVLCYKFAYAQQAEPATHSPTPYLLFPEIRLAVIRFDR